MSPASIIAALQGEDGMTLRQLFGRGHNEDDAMEVIDVLVRHGNITELDGRYYLRHSKLPPAEISPDPAPPPPRPPATPTRGGFVNTPGTRGQAVAEREAILRVLEMSSRPIKPREIAARANVPDNQIHYRLKCLADAGRIRSAGKGRWEAVAAAALPERAVAVSEAAEAKQAPVRAADPAAGAEEPCATRPPAPPPALHQKSPAGPSLPPVLHPAVRALLDELPPAVGEPWARKDAFSAAMRGVIDFLYPDR